MGFALATYIANVFGSLTVLGICYLLKGYIY